MIRIDRVGKDQWEEHCAAHAHRAVFSEHLPPEFERIDYALVATDGLVQTDMFGLDCTPAPLAYITVRELDQDTVYLKRGGIFDGVETIVRLPIYLTFLRWLDVRYERQTTLVENTNIRYLKLAMTAGFRAIGIRNFQGSILLELLRERA